MKMKIEFTEVGGGAFLWISIFFMKYSNEGTKN